MLNDKFSLTFDGRYYKLNLAKINEFCLVSRGKTSSEGEITEAYESDENGVFHLTSKINREVKSQGNNQDDMIIYDFVKTLIGKLLEGTVSTRENENDVDFGFALAFNTLIAEGLLEEIKTNE
jgi:hypothetical protein